MVRRKIDARELSEVLDRSAVVPLRSKYRIANNRTDDALSIYSYFAAPSVESSSSHSLPYNCNTLISTGGFSKITISLILRWSCAAKIVATIIQRFLAVFVVYLNQWVSDAQDETMHLDSTRAATNPHRSHSIEDLGTVLPQRPFSSPSRHTDALVINQIDSCQFVQGERNVSLCRIGMLRNVRPLSRASEALFGPACHHLAAGWARRIIARFCRFAHTGGFYASKGYNSIVFFQCRGC